MEAAIIDFDMQGQVCLITGATSGIGLVSTLALGQMGATVVVVGRDEERCQAVVEQIPAEHASGYLVADLSDLSQVRRVAGEFLERYSRLDVLLNNVGAVFFNRQLSSGGIEMTWALNQLCPFLLTHLLLDRLKATAAEQGEARIINVSSAAHRGAHIDFDDLQGKRFYNIWRAYGQSKLANLLFTFELDRRLRGSKITSNALHPGFVATHFGKNNGQFARLAMEISHLFARSPEKGAETCVYLASSPQVRGKSGLYFVDCRPTSASLAAYDEKVARKLWVINEEETGI